MHDVRDFTMLMCLVRLPSSPQGTRLIPEGALQGVQFLRAPSYVQVVGIIDQTKINIQAGDYGGEMDPQCVWQLIAAEPVPRTLR